MALAEKGMQCMVLVTLGVLTTTSQQIQGRPVREYLGIVSGDAVVIVHRLRRWRRGASIDLQQGRRRALRVLAKRASAGGATVVIGVQMSYVTVGAGRILVTATGTAVRL